MKYVYSWEIILITTKPFKWEKKEAQWWRKADKLKRKSYVLENLNSMEIFWAFGLNSSKDRPWGHELRNHNASFTIFTIQIFKDLEWKWRH